MRAQAIPVYRLDEFERLIEASPDVLLEHPCVVRGFVERWPAASAWTRFDYLRERFGHLPVTAGAPQFTTHRDARMCQVKTDYGTYLRYVEDPALLESLFDGQWVKGDAATLRAMGMPLYSGNLRLVRHAREAVLADIDPLVPGPLEYLNNDIPYYYQSGNHVWLYISLAGALTPLHQDNNAVIAYLAQLKGRKEAILYPPEDKPHFHRPGVGYLDPLRPNDEEFPTWRQARAWTASLGPGELLIWGPEWAHHVVTHETSITVSFDIVNTINLESYCRSMDWRHELGHFALGNAALIRERLRDEQVHAALDSGDEARIGREMMLCVLRASLGGEQASERTRRVRETMLRTLQEG